MVGGMAVTQWSHIRVGAVRRRRMLPAARWKGWGNPVLHALICLCVARFVHALCVFRLCSGEWRDPPAMVRRAAEAEHVHPGTVLGWGAGTVCTRIADSSRRSSHSQTTSRWSMFTQLQYSGSGGAPPPPPYTKFKSYSNANRCPND